MPYAMDGNDSFPLSSELPTGQHVLFGHYYLPRRYVDTFSEQTATTTPPAEARGKCSTQAHLVFLTMYYWDTEENPCLGRRKNMDNKKTAPEP